jgi:hypothetical protein
MAINLQEEYDNAQGEQAAPAPAAQDLVIPAAAAEQLAQALQQGDCQAIIQMVTGLMGGGEAPAPPAM